jgi:hypothetical protein
MPFRHGWSNERIWSRNLGLSGGWDHWFARLDSADALAVLDYSFSLVPPIRWLLYPELVDGGFEHAMRGNRGVGAQLPPRRGAFLVGGEDQEWLERYGGAALHLTLKGNRPWLRTPLKLAANGTTFADHSLRIEWMDLQLLQDHVGLVLVKVILESDAYHLAGILRHLKKVSFRRRLSVAVPTLEVLGGGSRWTWEEILRETLLTFDYQNDSQGVELAESHAVNWRVAVLFEAWEMQTSGTFDSSLEECAFCVAVGRSPEELGVGPSDRLLTILRSTNVVNPWQDWLALHHYDNLTFVLLPRGCTTLESLTHYREVFEYEYVALFALAHLQEFALQMMTDTVASIRGDAAQVTTALEESTAEIIRFNTRLWFPRLGTSPIGPMISDVLNAGLRLGEIHSQLNSDLDRLSLYVETISDRQRQKTAKRTEALLQFLTFVLAPLSLVASIVQPKLLAWVPLAELSPRQAWLVLFIGGLALLAVWGLVRWRGRAETNAFN